MQVRAVVSSLHFGNRIAPIEAIANCCIGRDVAQKMLQSSFVISNYKVIEIRIGGATYSNYFSSYG